MKTKNPFVKMSISCLLHLIVIILFFVSLLQSTMVFAQKNSGTLKIGVYDSRVVVFAYSRSVMFRERMKKMGQQSDSANKASDTVKIRELSIQAISFQHLLHLMVFGSGSIATITDLVKEHFPDVAKNAGVSMIVSKFELAYKDPSTEIIDLTDQISQLFKPTENIDKMVAEIEKTAPVPLDDLTIEEDMLDGYCKRFGKK